MFRVALMAGKAVALAGCGLADSRLPVPEFMATLHIPSRCHWNRCPTSRGWCGETLDLLFTAASNPRGRAGFTAAPARPGQRAGPRQAGVELTSVMGEPLGAETYRLIISGGMTTDWRRDDDCASETYEPI